MCIDNSGLRINGRENENVKGNMRKLMTSKMKIIRDSESAKLKES